MLGPAGTVEKKDLSDRDIQLIIDLFQQHKPHQIYAAGDLSDPHGTHRTCLQVNFLVQLRGGLQSVQILSQVHYTRAPACWTACRTMPPPDAPFLNPCCCNTMAGLVVCRQ